MKLLSIRDLTVHYGTLVAVKDMSMDVDQGSITVLLGANGAGKSTVMRTISGLMGLTAGEIWFGEKRIDGLPPETIVALGLSQVPEGRRVFRRMTVLENLEMGAFLRKDKKDKEEVKKDLEDIYKSFPILEERQRQTAGSLSGGEQQMLAIGRALMNKPRLLLMDEPSLGLSPILVKEIERVIRKLSQDGITISLVEQNAVVGLKLAHKAYVMETGSIVIEGTGESLMKDERIKKAYLT